MTIVTIILSLVAISISLWTLAIVKDNKIKCIGHLIKGQWFDYEKYVETVKTRNVEEVE